MSADHVIIGDCELWRGDALEILPALEAGTVDMVFADPPFGHNNNNGDLISRREAALGVPKIGRPRPIRNGGQEANQLFQSSLPEMSRVLKPGCCCCCCCCGGGPDPQFARWSLWLDEVFQFKQMVIWDKGPMGMGWHYRRSYETVLVAQKPGAQCRWFGGRSAENILRPGVHGIRKIIPKANQHPTQKPVELAMHFICLHTQPGDLVLDPFMGSGTTGMACLRTDRRFVGIEIEATFFEGACDRIRQEWDHKVGEGPLLRTGEPKVAEVGRS